MSRYTFDPKMNPNNPRKRRTIIGAVVAGAVLLMGVGLVAVGISAISKSGLGAPSATNTPFKPQVTIYAPVGAATSAPAATNVPTKLAAASATTGAVAATPTAKAISTMDPAGAVPGLADFVCPQPRPADPQKMGVGIKSNILVGDIGFWNTVVADKLKMSWLGMKVNWYEFEPQKGQVEAFKWQLMDAFVADANKKGLNIAMTITQPPQWARSAQDAPGVRPSPADDLNENVRFFSRIAGRYKGCVQAIEVFNEVNLDRDWKLPSGQMKGADYARYLQPISAALKKIDPNLLVVMAALSPTGANVPGKAMDDFVYMDELVAAGAPALVDCVGVHLNGFNFPPDKEWNAGYNDPTAKFRDPFDTPHHSWAFLSTITTYRQKTNKPICVTEFGWPSMENLGVEGTPDSFGFAADNTEKEQAEWIVKGFDIMRSLGYVRFGVVFNLDYIAKTDAPANKDNALPYSLIHKDGSPRPAFDALTQMAK